MDSSIVYLLDGPALEYEQLRRKIETQTRELSYFTSDQMNKITSKLPENEVEKWKNVIARFTDQNRSVFLFFNHSMFI